MEANMKTTTTFITFLLLPWFIGCSLLVSFDEPKKTCNDDFPNCTLPECANHPDCITSGCNMFPPDCELPECKDLLECQELHCTMVPPDCRLESCQSHDQCQPAGQCTVQYIFYDSPPACEDGYKCSPTGFTSVGCVQEIFFSSGDFYEPCTNLGYCPHGSFCLKHKSENPQVGFTPGAELCIPFCHLGTHPRCPGLNGECIELDENPMMDVCFSNDQCDPVEDSGCPSNKSCYLYTFDGTMCVKAGIMERKRPCQFNWDCKPGHICMDHDQSNWGLCSRVCREPEDCGPDATGCYRTGEYGLCAYIDNTSGN